MKTPAAVAHSLRSPFVVEDVGLPELHHPDVLVRIVGVGICHTDLASRDGQLAAQSPAIRSRGRRCNWSPPRQGTLGLVAAAPGPEKTVDLPWTNLLLQGQTVRGFVEGNSIPDIFIPKLCDSQAQGRLPFDRYVRFYPFHDINRAVEDQRNGRAIEPILEVNAA